MIIQVLSSLLVLAAPTKEKPVSQPLDCLVQLHVDRGDSPWQGFTSSSQEEQDGKHIKAVDSMAGLELPARLARYQVDKAPLLGIDRPKRTVVVNGAHLSAVERVDAPRLAKGQRHALGSVRSAALKARPRDLVLFLLDAQLIETYWHLESDLCLRAESDTPSRYSARVDGVHRYCTSKCHADPLAFTVEVDKVDGSIVVVGG